MPSQLIYFHNEQHQYINSLRNIYAEIDRRTYRLYIRDIKSYIHTERQIQKFYQMRCSFDSQLFYLQHFYIWIWSFWFLLSNKKFYFAMLCFKNSAIQGSMNLWKKKVSTKKENTIKWRQYCWYSDFQIAVLEFFTSLYLY